MAAPRYAEKFTSADGATISYSFPLNLYEWDSQGQALETPVAALTGAHYSYNQLAASLAPQRNAVESVRFVLKGTVASIEATIDEARSECYRIGLGKLWVLDSAGARRWAWARANTKPSYSIDSPFIVPMSLSFSRFSDWYGETAFDQTYTVDETPKALEVSNSGNARVYNAVFVLKGTFTNPTITNTTNGYRLKSNRDGSSASDWLRFDAGKNRVEFSADGGSSWSGDLANFVRKAGQAHLMVIEPGANAFTVEDGGAPNETLDVDFSHAFH